MGDPEPSSFLHQDNNNPRPFPPTHHLSSTLPPPSPSSNKHYHHHHTPPPPVKTRSHLSNLGDHIVKAARRLSSASTPKDPPSHPSSPSPLFSRLGSASPDIKKKRGSAIFLDDSTPTPGSGGGHSHSNSTNSNSNSSGVNSTIMAPPPRNRNNASGGEPKEKGKGKLLAKIDLFNMLSRNANHAPPSSSSFVGPTKLQQPHHLQQQQQQQQHLGIDRSSPGPPTPSKETFWRGIMVRQNGVCTEDDYRILPPLAQPSAGKVLASRTTTIEPRPSPGPTAVTPTTRVDPQMSPSSSTRIDSKFGSDSSRPAAAKGHTDMHDGIGVRNVVKQNNSARSRKGDSEDVENQTQGFGPSTQGTQDGQGGAAAAAAAAGNIVNEGKSADKRRTDARATPVVAMLPPTSIPQQPKLQPSQQENQQKQQQMAHSTMSQDLSHLSISSLQESDASLSDRSLQMEEFFDFYEDSSSGSLPGSAAQTPTTVAFSDAVHSGAPAPAGPLSALEKIQRQQRRRSQEQERLANLILPASVKNQADGISVLPTRDIPKELLPAHHAHMAATPSPTVGSPAGPGNAVEESIRLDQILALASGPNRPRLPNPIEWQKGLEEMRQRRRDNATPLTSSVGRHSQESSVDGGKSRRHSMPDLPPGQSREDQERQRGDGFRNPMLLRQIHESLAFGAGGTEDEFDEGDSQRQQMRRTGIADSQAMDATYAMHNTAGVVVLDEPPRPMRKRGVNVTGAPVGRGALHGKDAADVAFEELLDALALPPSARAELESMPKERKLAMLQSNDASQHLSQSTQTDPPQFFVDTLLEFAGKRERATPNQRRLMNLQIGSQPSLIATRLGNSKGEGATKPMGLWKNLSTTNIGQLESSEQHQQSQLLPTFQQHLASLMNRNNNEVNEQEKRSMNEREQVLKKLRVLIRNGSIRWTGEFIKAGGPMALIEYCHQIQKTQESKRGQRERLLHQVIQCIKAIVPLEGGISSLVQESSFFPLMRALAITESPVLAPTSESRQGRPGFISGAATTDYPHQQRLRSSSIPKPLPTRMTGHHGPAGLPFQSSPAPLALDQIPTFSNAQASVSVLAAILAREPELRDRILKETVADGIAGGSHCAFADEADEHLWTYSQWIGYLNELVQMCGVNMIDDTPVTPSAREQPIGKARPSHGMSKVSSVASGLSFLSTSPTEATSGLSLFSLDNIKRRRHTSAAATSTSPTLKYEAGEDREVISFLTAHLELVSKLMFDMHISVPGLAFAKSIRNSNLQEAFERILSSHVQSQDLCAQVEDLLIQISMVPKPYANNNYRTGIRSPGHQQHRVSYPQPQQKMRQEWLRPASASPQPWQQRQKQMQMPDPHQHQHRGPALQGAHATDHTKGIPSRTSSLNIASTGPEALDGGVAGGHALLVSRKPSAARRIAEGMVILGRDGAITPTRARFPPSPTPSPSLQPPRRATIGDVVTNTSPTSNPSYSTASHHASRLPVLPPKSKNRLSSVDPRSGLASLSQSPLSLHSHLPLPPANVDAGPRSQLSHQSRAPPAASPAVDAMSAVLSRTPSAQPTNGVHTQRQERSTGPEAPLVVANAGVNVNTRPLPARENATEAAPLELASSPPSQLPRPKVLRSNSGSSTNTFGNGERRSSLGTTDLPLITNKDQLAPMIDSKDTAAAPPTAKVGINPSTIRGHHLRPPRVPAAGLQLSSSSSISTSSSFTEGSSSSSSISPPSSQGRKQVPQQQTRRSTTTTTTVTGSRLPVPESSSLPLSSQASPTSAVSSKPMVMAGPASLSQEEDKVVDFDLKIQEDVRKLASAASSSSLSAQRRQDANSVDAMRRREIQETANPLVLSAPIVVREDLFRLRDQRIRDQFSAIVLPPLERP